MAASRVQGSCFSVIIPTFNRADLLPETVQSVLAQTYRNFEVIVVDDGSTDDTVGVLKPYLEQIRYFYQANHGLASARNRGIQEATGDFVAFLDSDDLYEPEFLSRVLETFRANHAAGAVFVAEREFVDTKTPPGRVYSKRTPGLYFDPSGMVGRDTGVGSGRPPVIRREWLEKLGGFNERIRCAVDSEMWIRYSFHVAMVFLPDPLIRRRRHPGNLSLDRAVDAEDWLEILGWILREHPEFVHDHPDVYRRALAKHHLRLGRELLALTRGDRRCLSRARQEILLAIRANPFFARALIYLVLSLVVPSTYGWWRGWRHQHDTHRGLR